MVFIMKHYINLAGCDRLKDGESITLVEYRNNDKIADFTQKDIDIANNALRTGKTFLSPGTKRPTVDFYSIVEDELKQLLLDGRFVEAKDYWCFDDWGYACMDYLYNDDEVANMLISEYTENPNSIDIKLNLAKIDVAKTLNILINNLFNEYGIRSSIQRMSKKYYMVVVDINKSVIRDDQLAAERLLSRFVDTIAKHCYVRSEIKLY